MSFIDDFDDCLPHSITIEPFLSNSGYGEPTYGTAKSYKGLIEQVVKEVTSESGEKRVSNTTVYLSTTQIIKSDARVTLPSDFSPQQPNIIAIARMSDESGIAYTILYC